MRRLFGDVYLVAVVCNRRVREQFRHRVRIVDELGHGSVHDREARGLERLREAKRVVARTQLVVGLNAYVDEGLIDYLSDVSQPDVVERRIGSRCGRIERPSRVDSNVGQVFVRDVGHAIERNRIGRLNDAARVGGECVEQLNGDRDTSDDEKTNT